MLLDGKVALVTGASRGIGAATAKRLAAEGAAVAVNYNASEGEARRVVAAIELAGGRAVAVRADVTDRAAVDEMVHLVARELGPVDVLVANAGMRVHLAPFAGYPWEAFEAKLVGEAKGVFFVAQAVVPSMISRRSGSIVVISSSLSRHAGEGFCAHSASKAALDAVVRAMALELGPHGVRVNTVAPGLTLTDATAFLPQGVKDASAKGTPLRRNGTPDDVAGAILALAADTGRHVTGVYLPVDGGVLMG